MLGTEDVRQECRALLGSQGGWLYQPARPKEKITAIKVAAPTIISYLL